MQVQGTIMRIRFRSEESGWTVFSLSTEDGEITCVGTFFAVSEGETWNVEGEFTYHDKYGEQIKVSRAEKIMPKTSDQLEKYLSSSIIPHIGPKTAKKLVSKYGEDVLRVLLEDENALLSVRGIGKKKAKVIREAIERQQATQEIAIYLQSLDLGPKTSALIYQTYGEMTIEIIENDPYRLVDEIQGVGFRTADLIAKKNGISPDSIFRAKAAIKYILQKEAMELGNCFIEKDELKRILKGLLAMETPSLDDAILELVVEGKIVEDVLNQRFYLSIIDKYENDVAVKLNRMAEDNKIELNFNIETIQRAMKIELSALQKKAVELVAGNKVVLITGGPGTGKTTILKAVLEVFGNNNLSTELAAPTGRAAKRMEESTGRIASTIHRLLGYRGGDNDFVLEKNEEEPLECDALVIDEASMIDIFLMGNLMRAIPDECRLILVGDVDQLPSVGPGNILRDLIKSERIPTIKLDKIYRQGTESLIVTNAHRIHHGMEPICNEEDKDFFFIRSSSAKEALDIVEDLAYNRIPKYYGFDPKNDIQILSAMKRGTCGVENLNEVLQRALNPAKENLNELMLGKKIYRVGDKIMQIKNDYKLEWTSDNGIIGEGVYNGDSGILADIDDAGEWIEVNFDGKFVRYEQKQMDEIDHSFAITIHKSQGSEFPCIIIPIVAGPPMLLSRNILYTAITRAQKLVVLVGSRDILSQMIKNEREVKRNSSLDEKIKSYSDVMNLFS